MVGRSPLGCDETSRNSARGGGSSSDLRRALAALGFSSSALSLMFTLGTALGAGFGGAIVALADQGVIRLVAAVAAVNGLMIAVAIGAVALGFRVPSRAERVGRSSAPSGAPVPIEHP